MAELTENILHEITVEKDDSWISKWFKEGAIEWGQDWDDFWTTTGRVLRGGWGKSNLIKVAARDTNLSLFDEFVLRMVDFRPSAHKLGQTTGVLKRSVFNNIKNLEKKYARLIRHQYIRENDITWKDIDKFLAADPRGFFFQAKKVLVNNAVIHPFAWSSPSTWLGGSDYRFYHESFDEDPVKFVRDFWVETGAQELDWAKNRGRHAQRELERKLEKGFFSLLKIPRHYGSHQKPRTFAELTTYISQHSTFRQVQKVMQSVAERDELLRAARGCSRMVRKLIILVIAIALPFSFGFVPAFGHIAGAAVGTFLVNLSISIVIDSVLSYGVTSLFEYWEGFKDSLLTNLIEIQKLLKNYAANCPDGVTGEKKNDSCNKMFKEFERLVAIAEEQQQQFMQDLGKRGVEEALKIKQSLRWEFPEAALSDLKSGNTQNMLKVITEYAKFINKYHGALVEARTSQGILTIQKKYMNAANPATGRGADPDPVINTNADADIQDTVPYDHKAAFRKSLKGKNKTGAPTPSADQIKVAQQTQLVGQEKPIQLNPPAAREGKVFSTYTDIKNYFRQRFGLSMGTMRNNMEPASRYLNQAQGNHKEIPTFRLGQTSIRKRVHDDNIVSWRKTWKEIKKKEGPEAAGKLMAFLYRPIYLVSLQMSLLDDKRFPGSVTLGLEPGIPNRLNISLHDLDVFYSNDYNQTADRKKEEIIITLLEHKADLENLYDAAEDFFSDKDKEGTFPKGQLATIRRFAFFHLELTKMSLHVLQFPNSKSAIDRAWILRMYSSMLSTLVR